MAQPRLTVQHLIACPLIEVQRAGPGNPYTLRDVSYEYLPSTDLSGGLRFEVMYLFARFFGRPGVYTLELDFVWQDDPAGPRSALALPTLLPPVRLADGQEVLSRAFRLMYLPIPGPGRYTFELYRVRSRRRNRLIGREFILVGSIP